MYLPYLHCNFKILLIIIIVFTQCIINVKSEFEKILDRHDVSISTTTTTTQNEISDDFTVIYRITNSSIERYINDYGFEDENFDSIYNGKYSTELYSRRNLNEFDVAAISDVRDFMATSGGTNIFENNSSIDFTYNFYHWTLNHRNLIPGTPRSEIITDSSRTAEYYIDYNIMSNNNNDILKIKWRPRFQYDSLAIEYVFQRNERFDLLIHVYDNFNELLYDTQLSSSINRTTLIIQNKYFNREKEYKIWFIGTSNPISVPNPIPIFEIYRITNFLAHLDDVNKTMGKYKTSPLSNQIPIRVRHKNYLKTSDRIASSKYCLNGGLKPNNATNCFCPPGFRGPRCEEGCGPNAYGADCSGLCSIHKKGCRGTFLCVNGYGCSCPPGLTGPLCDQVCHPHKYGADCSLRCPRNCHENICDPYTGACTHGCRPTYMPPSCAEKYVYLLNAPILVTAGYDKITIEIDFTTDNLNDKNQQSFMKYYQLVYKVTDGNENFTKTEIKSINSFTARDTVINLKTETPYDIGVLLIIDDGNFNDQDIVFGHYVTNCSLPIDTAYEFTTTVENGNINVTWNKILPGPLDCKITNYTVTLTIDDKHNSISENHIVQEPHSSYTIDDLLSGYAYGIQLTPWTSLGPMPTSAVFKIKPTYKDEDIEITNVRAKAMNKNNTVHVSWRFVVNGQINSSVQVEETSCVVKYKINRILSCSLKGLENNWTSVIVHNKTNYEIPDVIPNAQYEIQVISNDQAESIVQRKNVVYALTFATKPSIEPVLDLSYPIQITNSSVSIRWNVDAEKCANLNGIFLKYVLDIKDKSNSTIVHAETTENHVRFDSLRPDTDYELKVYVHNNIGYNTDRFLLVNFKTKYGNLKPIGDLIVYKKSLNDRMIGLRWNHSDNENLDGFIVSFHRDVSQELINVTVVEPTKCVAWPSFYCHTFVDLNFSKNAVVKVKARSLEYPEGSEATSVKWNFLNGIPDSPNNFKAIQTENATVTLQWDIPWVFNGFIKSFVLNGEEIASVDPELCCATIAPEEIPLDVEQPAFNFTFTDLKPGSTYIFGIMSKSSWYSSPSKTQVTTLL